MNMLISSIGWQIGLIRQSEEWGSIRKLNLYKIFGVNCFLNLQNKIIY